MASLFALWLGAGVLLLAAKTAALPFVQEVPWLVAGCPFGLAWLQLVVAACLARRDRQHARRICVMLMVLLPLLALVAMAVTNASGLATLQYAPQLAGRVVASPVPHARIPGCAECSPSLGPWALFY